MNYVIGGEFKIDEKLFEFEGAGNSTENLILSSGRCALFAILADIIHEFDIKNILLPDYLCDSVTQTVIDAEWEYKFYHISIDFSVERASLDELVDRDRRQVVLLINYFGVIDRRDEIKYIRDKFPQLIIIEDNAQAFYNESSSHADYSFTSIRKWFPCPDGAVVHKYLLGQFIEVELFDNDFVKYKLAGNYLKGLSKYIDDKIILELLDQGETKLKEGYLCNCSSVSKRIFESLNLKKIAEARKENARVLHEELARLHICHVYDKECVPLFVPILISNRDYIRKKFFEKKIFTPQHWPHVSNELNGNNRLYDMELSLICDQRYNNLDMFRQIEILEKYEGISSL